MNELYHHGVKGMHWGVRRYQNPDGTYTNAGKRHRTDGWSEDAKNVHELKKKNIKELSNAELRKINERRQLERTYYSSIDPTLVTKGVAYTAAAVGVMGTSLKLYKHSSTIINLGKKFISR